MNIDFLFNFKKIKYEIMTELFENIKLSKTVNIIIDFDTLFETFKLEYYKNMVEKLATAENKFHFISAVFNFIGHYRNFFATRLDTHTRFFVLYNSKNDSIRDAIKPDFTLQYDRNMQNKKFALFILNKCKLLNNYFPDISFIDSEDIHHTLVPNILINNLSYFKTEKTIFLNDNPLYFQYLELFNGCMLNPSNNSSNIMSVKNEYFKRFLKRSKYKYTEEEEKEPPKKTKDKKKKDDKSKV
jgi:hypothetical protein